MDNPHKGHRERVRARFFAEGLEHFAPHEVLEYLLFLTTANGDTNPTAHRLIGKFGSLSGVFEARYEDLCTVEGVGPKSAQLICSIPGLTRAYYEDTRRVGQTLETTESIRDFLEPRFIGAKKEHFYLVCLDGRRRVLLCQRLNEGTISKVHVDMRSLMEIVLRVGATGIILAHNHPAQLAVPSSDDVNVTRYIHSVMRSISVRVIDHLIFSNDDAVSMRQSGYFTAIDTR